MKTIKNLLAGALTLLSISGLLPNQATAQDCFEGVGPIVLSASQPMMYGGGAVGIT